MMPDCDITPEEEEINELMENYDLDKDTAEKVKDIMDEYDVDEDEAIEMGEAGL